MLRIATVVLVFYSLVVGGAETSDTKDALDLYQLHSALTKLSLPLPSAFDIQTALVRGKTVVSLDTVDDDLWFFRTRKTVQISYRQDNYPKWEVAYLGSRERANEAGILLFIILISLAIVSGCLPTGIFRPALFGMLFGILTALVVALLPKDLFFIGIFIATAVAIITVGRGYIIMGTLFPILFVIVLFYAGETGSGSIMRKLLMFCGFAMMMEFLVVLVRRILVRRG